MLRLGHIYPRSRRAPRDFGSIRPAGADTNSGAKASPLRTLAEAARRVNQSTGDGAVTIVLTEGIHAIGETTLLKPERRSFTKTARLTIRAEVLPDDPEWHTGRMPTLIHTMPLPKTWNGRPDPSRWRRRRHDDRNQSCHDSGTEGPGPTGGREPETRA